MGSGGFSNPQCPKCREMSSMAEGLMSSSGSVRSVAHAAAEHEGVRGGVGSVWRRRAGGGVCCNQWGE